MERRRAMSSYAKLKEQQRQNKQEQLEENDREHDENPDQQSALRRSHSVRASLRRLKSKLQSPALPLQSPFKLRPHLHRRSRSCRTVSKSKAVQALSMWHEIDKVAVLTKSKNKTMLQERLHEDDVLGINHLMSTLPVGAALPRKVCKLLQIPESYSEATSDTAEKSHSDPVQTELTCYASQGIYGTTRMRTATIRKPMPHLNIRRCLTLGCEYS